MATRFIYKALLTVALGIALSPLLAATTTGSPAPSDTAEALQLDPPAAPSDPRARTYRERDRRHGIYKIWTVLSWTDNSTDEDGFTVETWFRDNGAEWVLIESWNVPANHTAVGVSRGAPLRYRVRAFNASGDSAWSSWAQ